MSAQARLKSGRFISSQRAKGETKRDIFKGKTESSSDRGQALTDSPTDQAEILDRQVNAVSDWQQGRRIVEMGHFADQLVCDDCDVTLSLRNIFAETRNGYGSLLYINCTCGTVNAVSTSKRHQPSKRGGKVFDVNTKAALGMLHSGIGHRQIESFMSVLEIPVLAPSTMKRREKEIASYVETMAVESCAEALREEVSMIEPCDSTENQFLQTPCSEFKYDMGWQKRGSGRSYDSKSGVGTLMGNKSGKIVAYGLRSKDCRKCSYFESKSETTPTHQCSRNWHGSSKAMEPDVARCLVLEIENKNVNVDVIIMDDDATTMAKIKETVSHPVKKWSDINHKKKLVGNQLYNLQKTHKSLTTKVIQYFQKCFSYAVIQNKGDPEGLARSFKQIVPHSFGEHSICDSWCGYQRNPDTYKHSSMPYGRDLSGEELRKDLEIVFAGLVRNVDKIAPGASTHDVESFNNLLASKAPKRCHYSSSSSLKNRLNCAVAQKNVGNTYINQVNMKMGISPGTFYSKLARKRDKLRAKRLQHENTKQFKKRKLNKKLKNRSVCAQKELREGISYMSGVANIHISNVTEIPAPVFTPQIEKVHCEEAYNLVYCDIETTSLCKKCDIVQLSAICNNDQFNHYILPSKPIVSAASEVTGLTCWGNQMFHNGQLVQSKSLKVALNLFLIWLQSKRNCILVGHNFLTFDLPRLIRKFDVCNLLGIFQQTVTGSVDTLKLFKNMYPNLECYRQEYLVSHFLNANYSAHNALADVKSLQMLVNHFEFNRNVLFCHSESLSSSVEKYKHGCITDNNMETLACLLRSKVVSPVMAKKIASSGLCLPHLKLAIAHNGYEGLSQLFKAKLTDGKARVTNLRRIIENVYRHLAQS